MFTMASYSKQTAVSCKHNGGLSIFTDKRGGSRRVDFIINHLELVICILELWPEI